MHSADFSAFDKSTAEGSGVNVLIGCESSGTVRDAFIRRGHRAMSCDLLATDALGPHYQGDIFDVIDYPWDLAIFHPPCTDLSVSGSGHFEAKWMDGRQAASAAFFMKLQRASAHIPKTVSENPVCIMSSLWRKPDQIIQPYQFGHDASKKTCLWLKGLKPLLPTQMIEGRMVDGMMRWANQTDSGQNRLSPSDDRWKIRSKTYEGIAEAMALQWGGDAVPAPAYFADDLFATMEN